MNECSSDLSMHNDLKFLITQILTCLQTRRQASLDVNPSLSTTRTNLEVPMDISNQQSVSGWSMTSVCSIF